MRRILIKQTILTEVMVAAQTDEAAIEEGNKLVANDMLPLEGDLLEATIEIAPDSEIKFVGTGKFN